MLNVGRARGRDETEEDEDEHLAETFGCVGAWTAAVAEQGDERTEADEQQPPGHARGEHNTGNCSHQLDSAASTSPATPATAKAITMAVSTCRGVAAPEPTRRSGPTRTASVPRTPSE